MNRRTRGLLLLALGLLALAASAGLSLYNARLDRLAGERAAQLLSAVERRLPEETAGDPAPDEAVTEPEKAEPPPEGVPWLLRVPSVGIDLPVLDEWSYERLDTAPCRYSGSLETGDLVILGHSYRTHLRPLRQVAVGDAVELTEPDGTVHRFVAAETEILRGSQGDRLDSAYPLTIFTCTADSRHRFLVRCAEAETP